MNHELVEELYSIALDVKKRTADRIEAITLIMAYGHGRPVQGVISARADITPEPKLRERAGKTELGV